MPKTISLKPDFKLLNSNFDGYKLNSDPDQTIFMRDIENGIFENDPFDGTCYLFTRMESLHNHLFSDPFEVHTVYVYNKKGHLLMFNYTEGFVGTPLVVWQEDLKEIKQEDSIESQFVYSPSVSFPSSNFALTSNGRGSLNIFETGDRTGNSSWVSLTECKVPFGNIINSVHIDSSADPRFTQEIHTLLLSVITPKDLKTDPLHSSLNEHLLSTEVSALHIIYWFSFCFDGLKWTLERERRVCGFKSLEYVSLDPKGEAIVLLSHDNYYFVYDSLRSIETERKEEKGAKAPPKYMFKQNNEELTLWLNTESDVTKEQVCIDVSDKDIKIRVKEQLLFEKKFFKSADGCAATWKIEKRCIEVCIPKAEENLHWPSLFEGGDEGGEEVLDAALVERGHQRLAHLTSDQLNPDPESDKPAFDPGQLEDCDDASEDLLLSAVDGSSHALSHQANLGTVQHLFNVQLEGSVIPAFCLRHDVDGVLWRLTEDLQFDHASTFHAFGFVKASKTMAKFTRGAPDNSYVAVCDVTSHVYVFFQPDSFGGELRNRRSGKLSTTLARQQIISLKNHEQVMGFHTAPTCIFVLTKSNLIVYTLKSS